MRRSIRRLAAALACVLTLAGGGAVLAGLMAAPALAASCPGSNGECPYSSASIIGMRAEGILRFPEAVAVHAYGNVYVADQLSYVVQKFSAAGAYLGQWGSFGGGHGQFGPIGGLATDAAGNVYVVDSSHNRIEKFSPSGEYIKDWGHFGSELGQFNFGSSQDPTKPPGGGIAVYGSYVYVADSGNDRIERFNLEGGEALEWGSYGTGPGQFSYPRGVAANGSEVLVTDDDNHRIEKFTPAGQFEGLDGSEGSTGDRFDFPYGIALDAASNVYVADDINHRVVKLSPSLDYLTEWGGFGSKPAQLAFPRGLAADPAGETFVADTANDRVQVFDPEGHFLRTIGASAREPGPLTGPRGLAIDPTGRLFVSDTVDSRVEEFAPGSDAYLGTLPSPGGYTTGFNRPAGIAVDPRGSVYVTDPADGRISRFWGDGTYLSEIGGPADVGGAGLSEAGSAAVASGSGDLYVADTNHNRILVYSPAGTLLARFGAGAGNGSSGSGPGELDHPEAVAVDGSGDAYVADTGNDRIVELLPLRRAAQRMGFARERRRALPLADRDRARRRRQRLRRRLRKRPRRGVRLLRSLPGEVGRARDRPRRILLPDRRRRRLRRRRLRRRHEQQPCRALQPRLALRLGLPRARPLAAPAERRAGTAGLAPAAGRRARAGRAHAERQLSARLPGARLRDALQPAPATHRQADLHSRHARSPSRRQAARPPRPERAARAAARARAPPRAARARHDRRRRTHRAAHDALANLLRHALIHVAPIHVALPVRTSARPKDATRRPTAIMTR